MSPKTVVVGMSGGVDSSVAALLLKRQGFQVIGLFMKNWEEEDAEGGCSATTDYEDVVRVCDQIDIPCYSVNFSKEYQERVFSHFLEELKKGDTPNPDILCNREIKFDLLLTRALELGGDALATGHYCRVGGEPGQRKLLRGKDPTKDQSYFLYTVTSAILDKVLFPIGELPKSEVRQIARDEGLITATKKDSTGICFIGKRDFKTFVSRYIPYHPGVFETPEGKVVGTHDGSAYYTVGQRKGLGIGGPGDAWYVVGKDLERNVVFVVQGEHHPALYRSSLHSSDLHFIHRPPESFPFSCSAKIRYRQTDSPCMIHSVDRDVAEVLFSEPQRAVTPRQSIVFYRGEECLGGGMICSERHAFQK